MSKQTVFPPRTPGNSWAYWKVDNINKLPAETKRRRNEIAFIPTAKAMTASVQKRTCIHCNKPLGPGKAQEGAEALRGDYNPKTRGVRLYHYTCAWGATLNDILIHNMTAVETGKPAKWILPAAK